MFSENEESEENNLDLTIHALGYGELMASFKGLFFRKFYGNPVRLNYIEVVKYPSMYLGEEDSLELSSWFSFELRSWLFGKESDYYRDVLNNNLRKGNYWTDYFSNTWIETDRGNLIRTVNEEGFTAELSYYLTDLLPTRELILDESFFKPNSYTFIYRNFPIIEDRKNIRDKSFPFVADIPNGRLRYADSLEKYRIRERLAKS